MASGKSSIGKKLAKKLSLDFIDLDDFIVSKEKMSISDIFVKKGEIYFRKIESIYLNEVLQMNKSYILALGGGTPCYGNNMELIKDSNSNSFYLQASVNKLSQKLISKREKRPLVASLNDEQIFEYVGKHIFERRQFYEKAKYTIKTDNKKKSEIVNEIKSILN